MDGLSLQVSCAAKLTLSLLADDLFLWKFSLSYDNILTEVFILFTMKFRDF